MFQSRRPALRAAGTTIAAVLMLSALLPALGGCGGGDRPAVRKSDSGAIHLRDAIGQEVTLPRPATRVVSLAPNLTEIIAAIGAADKLVGRSTHCDYPPEVLSVPAVGDLLSLNYEAILARKPDLVLMSFVGNTGSNYSKLQQLGLRPYAIDASSLTGLINSIDTVGILLGREAQAHVVHDRLRALVDSIARLGAASSPVSTFIVIDRSPLMTVSRGFLTDMVKTAGGANIVEGSAVSYPLFNREELLRRDPEVILVPSTSAATIDELLRTYPEWQRLRAVRNHRLYPLPENIVERPGPRIGAGLTAIYEALHGADPRELFAKYSKE
jgi:ABC-type Fe3+-hydroxamate transport system substrate-binding protein